jgi:hypothetical protein
MGATGAIDLYAGRNSISGSNIFDLNKSPLSQLNAGTEDVIGEHGQNVGDALWKSVQMIIDSILGLDPSSMSGKTANDIITMFENVWNFLGELNPTSPTFDPLAAIVTFINSMLKPSNLIATLVADATHSGGVTGFIPLENLALDAIEGAVGSVQQLIDAIMNFFGFGAGTASYDEVQKLFGFFYQFLGAPSGWLSDLTDAGASIIGFIEHQLMPTNLLTGFDMFMLHWRTGLNLVLDPSFETTLAWPGAIMGVQSTDHARTGTHSMKITSDGTTRDGHLLRNQVGPLTQYVKSGQTFDVEAFVYPDPATATAGTGHLDLVMIATESTGSDPSSEVSATRIVMPTTGQWTWMRGKVTVPSTYNYDTADFVFRIESDIPTGDIVYIDDIAVIDTSAQQDILQAILNSVGLGGILNVTQLDTFFHNLTAMLGLPTLADVSFDIENAINNFVNNMLDPSVYFSNLTAMLGLPTLSDVAFDVTTAIQTFITDMLHPANLLAPLEQLTSGVFTIPQLNIPGLDATKIISGIFGTGQIPNLDASKIISGVLNALQIPGLDATKIITGTFTAGQIPSLLAGWGKTVDATLMANVTVANTAAWLTATDQNISDYIYQAIHGGTTTGNALTTIKTSLQNIPGLNIVSAVLASIIPALDATKITTGIFTTGQIPNLDASKIVTGVLNALQIPGLDASKIISGVVAAASIPNITKAMSTDMQSIIDNVYQASFGGSSTGNTLASVKTSLLSIPGVNIISSLLASVIPALDATKITTGTFPQSMLNITSIAGSIITGTVAAANIAGLDATKIISGIFTTGQIPNLDASKIVTGVLNALQIPGLDATKIISGVVAAAQIPNITAAMSTDIQALVDGAFQAMHGGTSTGNLVSTFKTSLLNIPGANIISAILASIVPGLDATKIVTGTFPQSMLSITSIAGSIITGTVAAANIAGLDATKIISGIFTTGQIPNLDASKIVSGVLNALQIPGLDATKITSGIFTTGQIPNLDASKIVSGVLNALQVPGLDASKIISGTFANSMSPGLLPQSLWKTSTTAGTNLVLSPDFEDNTVARTASSFSSPANATFTYSTTQAHGGTQSYAIQTASDVSSQWDVMWLPGSNYGTNSFDQMTRCQAGQWFYMELYIRAKSTNTATSGLANFGLFLANSASGGSTQTAIWTQTPAVTSISTTGWTKMSGWVQVPVGYDLCCAMLTFSNQNVGAQTYYIDDARCVEETQPQSITDLFSQGLYGASRPAIPVVFDAVGAGVQLDSTVVTENHTITGPNAVVFVSTYDTPGTLTVRIGGSSGPLMTQVASVSYSSSPVDYLFAFVLQNAPTGVQQIYASASNAVAMSINSESFSSAVSFGTPVTAFSNAATTPSLTVGGTNTYDRVVAAFGGYSTSFTGFNQTQRSNQPFTPGAGLPLVIGDAPGAASVNFSCTNSNPWGGIAIPISGTPASSTNTGNPVSSLFAGLQDMMTRIYSQPTLGSFIPGLNVQSPIGGVLTDVTTAFQTTVDKTIQGVTGSTGSGNAVGQLASVFNQAMGYLGFNFNNQTTPPTNSVAGTTGTNQTSLNNRAVTKPSYNAIDPTADSVFPLSSISGSSSATTVSVTAAQSAMGIIGTPDAGVKQSVEWLGYGPATITGVYYNIYSMNGSTGALTLVYASPNVVGNITLGGSSPTWVNLAIPAANYLTAQQNTYYAMEVVVAGTGTYSLAGINHAWLPSAGHPTAYPKQLAVTRAISAGTIAIDASPAGNNVAVAGAATQNTNVTIAATATALVVGVTVVTAANTTSAPTISCKIGSTTLAQLGVYQSGPIGGVCSTVALYGLINPPTGAQTITTTATPNPLASDAAYLSVCVDTYTNVASFGTAQTANGSTAAASHTVTSGATGGRIVQMFGVVQANVSLTLSAYNQTQRQNVASGASSYGSCVMGDAAGAASVTISATISSAAAWGSVAVPLNPAPAAPPSSIPSPTWSQTVPWMALSGAAAATTYAPLVTQYAAAGSYTYSVPSWMKAGNHFDILVVGAGMGGQGGGGPSNGVGGGAGIWATPVTLVYGVDIPTSTTNFTVTIGAGGIGGAGGGGFPSGSAGAQSSVAMTGHTTIAANGGSSAAGSTTGLSPGNQPLTGADGYAGIYYGGGTQPAAGANGNAPGGGGGGGIWGYFNALAAGPGGKGGDGGVWIRAYM